MPLHKGDEMKFKRTLVIIFVIIVAFIIIFLFRAAIARVASVIALAAIFAYLALPLIKILEKRTGRTVAALLGIVILIFADICKHNGIVIRSIIQKQDSWFRCVFIALATLLILLFGMWGPAFDQANFIYFQF